MRVFLHETLHAFLQASTLRLPRGPGQLRRKGPYPSHDPENRRSSICGPDMNIFRWDNALLITEYATLSLICVFSLWLTFRHAQAVSLSITGHCTGSGILSMNYTGNALNVSILQNGTAWVINATGVA